jgi:lipopolysaccharide/colanic/teichoic acid biosynthesis glycosyltransferase
VFRYPPFKRLLDIIGAGTGLIVLAPALALIAVAVRMGGGGPVLYRSARVGIGGRPFQMLKFRTMIDNAPDLRNADGSTYAGEDDPRITTLGRWLRRTSLDEVPLLWNVLAGEMSLVGPRPDLPDQLRFYSDRDRERLAVRPGITGLAQVTGRNALTWEQRRALDVKYVRSMSFTQDVRLLLRTVPGVLSARGVFGGRVDGRKDLPRER